jgi:GT2 family glycosyltransferase
VVDGARDIRVLNAAVQSKFDSCSINRNAVGNVVAFNMVLNLALAYKPEFVCIINSDIYVTPQWLNKLLEGMATDEKIGMVVPTFSACGPNSQNNPNREIRADAIVGDPIGSCVLFRVSALKDVGLYDERFNGNLGREDTDMNKRMMDAGWKILLKGDVCLEHDCSSAFSDIHGAGSNAALAMGNKLYEEKWNA